MKAWFLRWLGIVPPVDYSGAIAELRVEHDAAIAELVHELNDLRNSIPATTAAVQQPGVRVLRNWRDVRSALETPPIRIERKA